MMRPVRTAFIGPGVAPIGGVETWHHTLLTHLDRSVVEPLGVGVMNPEGSDRDTIARYEAMDVLVAKGAQEIYRLLRIVEVAVVWGLDDLGKVLREPRPKVLFVVHGDASNRWTVRNCQRLAPRVDRFVAVSRAGLACIPEHRRDSAIVIPNAYDPTKASPGPAVASLRAEWTKELSDTLVGFVGRLSPEKGIEKLVRAFGFLGPSFRLVVAGDGELRQVLEYDAVRLAGGRVTFLGIRRDTADIIAACDLIACPSRGEGSSLTVLEAMAIGVPVLSTPCGLLEEHPELAIILPPNAPPFHWSEAIRQVAAVLDCAKVKAAVARQYVRFHHHPISFARRWEEAIQELAADRTDPSPPCSA